MKAITTIFESMLGKDDSLVWTPADGPTKAFADASWDGASTVRSVLGMARLTLP